MGVRLELDDLPPRYRAQAELQILQRKSERLAGNRAKSDQFRERNGQNREIQPKNSQKRERFTKDAPESEKRYYREIILPKVAAGLVAEVREQVRFDLLPEKEYCELKLPARALHPGFCADLRRWNGRGGRGEIKIHPAGAAGLYLPAQTIHRPVRRAARVEIYRVHNRWGGMKPWASSASRGM